MRGILLLLKYHLRAAANLRRIVLRQSRFKVGFILLFAVAMLAGLWSLFLEGFRFLDSLGGVGLMLISRLFILFFFGMGLMLMLSGVATSYTTFFRDEETSFLMLKPLTIGQVVVLKYLESAGLASWAFFFVIIPFVGSYAWYEGLPLFFSLWTFVFSVPFVLLCSGAGSILCMILVRWLPRGRILAAGLAPLALAAAWWIWKSTGRADLGANDTLLLLNRMIPGMKTASHPIWPSWWVAEGIMSLTRGQWARGAMLWGVLVSNLLVVGLIVEGVGRGIFYDAWQRVISVSSRARKRAVLLRFVERLLSFVASDMRGIVLKDMRLFLRDPAQWSQTVVFFGLLALYFLNLRHFRYNLLADQWRNLIAFLNVFSVSAVMCSLGSRFVYPQLSLEGHGFWIVGLSPTTMGRVLVAKFGASALAMLAISVVLMVGSASMLAVQPAVQMVSLAIAVGMSCAIAGLSTGLGAVFLDLENRNTAAIVSGFGGTLNLVLSLGYMIATIVPFGFVFHLKAIHQLGPAGFRSLLILAGVWGILATACSTAIPLWLGWRSLKEREY